ncbi:MULTISPECIES: hypothetical protein [Sphingomonas]|uniref:Class I SAM-dependent methyltransferase n=1 Tax=Sphingomonas zeae TaxID=1646122 RepID=A0A7Y6B224_9SPHN|nr:MULTISPECIES: hypothetical protein [Sphingomonas]MBB4049603.1 hypothetical protein [Sphingomonas zeae]MDK8188024.1 hypothetical protein [Sphingomonas zeae]MDK8217908.1 hypothetical protein [Sphingomonas sp. UMB7805-LC452B]NUU45985.1 hypothetical protein [Sphingomonas zeae]
MSTGSIVRAAPYERAADDWYVEPQWCVEQLADAIAFEHRTIIWDPCCGRGTIPDAFRSKGYVAYGSDIVDRGCAHFLGAYDVLGPSLPGALAGFSDVSAVTNPPFKIAEAIARQLLAKPLRRVAILQQLSFLASQGRQSLFTDFPPSDVLVLSQRPSMPPGHMIADLGDRAFRGGTTDFCWIVWTRPHDRETRTRWLPITTKES